LIEITGKLKRLNTDAGTYISDTLISNWCTQL